MSNFDERYAKLNVRQKEAVDAIDGPVLVIAGPGSGKTELLGLRAANILRLTDTDPGQILCLTFTDAAAHNMRERLAGLIGKDAYKVAIHTFHSFGSEIINRHGEYFYQGADYAPIDDISKTEIIEKVIKELKWHSRLKSYHPAQGYTYLGEIKSRIDDIKKGGLTPEEFEMLIIENKNFEDKVDPLISKIFSGRISAAIIPELEGILTEINKIKIPKRKFELPNYPSEKDVLTDSLQLALRFAEETEETKSKTKPITRWKSQFLKKNSEGKWLLASHFKIKDLLDLAEVYKRYQEEIHSKGFYDFSDMILDTVGELGRNQELRYELQEKFLYVMVDEYQDTSGVQMELLDAILNKEINEGRPNILAVGDDDQSIYKFQGANIRNVNEFLAKFRDVKKIVLVENYRSTQEILDYSKSVIERAEDRLTRRDPEIVKDLFAANKEVKSGKLTQKEFGSKIEQYIYITEEIKKIRERRPGEEIAVISRKHSDLEDLSAVFNYHNIPVLYERSRDILEEKHIKEIITICRFVNSLNQNHREEADEYLPEILSYEFLDVDRIDIWKISCLSLRQNRYWLEVMLEYNDKTKSIAQFLIALGAEAKNEVMEKILDYITGVKKLDGFDYGSNFRDYYFSNDNFNSDRLRYLIYLFDLQTLFRKLREFRSRDTLYIKDLVEFIDLHAMHKMAIYESEKLSTGKSAVNLLTAHKAKGLEFDTVFIINCNENTWIRIRNNNKLSFPPNISLTPEKDNIDDRIRLFFVAVTRAKSNLYLTNYEFEDDKKNPERLRFLDQDLKTEEIESVDREEIKTEEELINFREELRHYEVNNADEKELLRSILEDYKLSPTHLNNFIDITKGGPALFLEHNLLRFPESRTAASCYGTAVHNCFTETHELLKERGNMPGREEFCRIFESNLRAQKLGARDFREKLEKGNEELGFYYENSSQLFNIDDIFALSFKHENVMIGDCPVTGEIDRVSCFDDPENVLRVFDYKTGKPFSKWDSGEDYLRIKSHKYRYQLIFYKILIENSRSYNKFKVGSGVIDFVTAKDGRLVKLELDIAKEDVEKLKALIKAVYTKIINLDFPEINKYPQGYEGVLAFEEDLIKGRI
jgi:DNA helicase-2/ATP-dependent DNA helicase PcrA